MRRDPVLFIGTVKIVLTKKVMSQSASHAGQISLEENSRKVKRPRGPEVNNSPGRRKMIALLTHKKRKRSTPAKWTSKGRGDAFLISVHIEK
jgi:hypothetical protein